MPRGLAFSESKGFEAWLRWVFEKGLREIARQVRCSITSSLRYSPIAVDLNLRGKIAVVTGASKGIGLACVEALARECPCRGRQLTWVERGGSLPDPGT